MISAHAVDGYFDGHLFDSEPCQPTLWGSSGTVQHDAAQMAGTCRTGHRSTDKGRNRDDRQIVAGVKKRRKMNLLVQKLIAPLFLKNSKLNE
ncbi:hypothetical protein [Herbaspirillum sp. alder98]|uniref:hypothetical protein n=1 Tax=Herbaspirillum sp. alder98 TaxID=2913096 RepID=UPI001CD878FD|nr:hypothetical protein [Herbaspirillum sp. alder98]